MIDEGRGEVKEVEEFKGGKAVSAASIAAETFPREAA
jgi:hypothetical protein